jgi:small-conductance mechanosensitive channel
MTKALKLQLDAANISIPYPQRTVHLIQSKSE